MNIDWSLAPEGATHYHPTKGICAHWFKPGHFCLLGFEAGGWMPDTSPLRDRSGYFERPTEWAGDGLPPVDLECEVMGGGLPSTAFDWERCTILLINEGADGKPQVCTRDFRGDLAIYYPEVDSVYFRPIRTAEQIAAEEREAAIQAMCEFGVDAGDNTIYLSASALYDAGYRKQEQR